MGSRGTEVDVQPTADSTPEDVAALYSWANLQGAKYRDYSASRREYRAHARYHAAKTLLDRELKAQEEAEASAAEAERLAFAAEATDSQNRANSPAARAYSRRNAEEAARKAAVDRVEAARRAEAAAHAAVLALREEREISEAHTSARRKELLYDESEQRRRQLAGPQPRMPRGEGPVEPFAGTQDSPVGPPPYLQQFLETRLHDLTEPREGSYSLYASLEEAPVTRFSDSPDLPAASRQPSDDSEFEAAGPAWLYASQAPPQARGLHTFSQPYKNDLAGGDTLQDSRERVAARWFALKGVFDNPAMELPAMQPPRTNDARTRLLAFFSLAGGVGKTTLAATLGRALSAQEEKIVLTDTTPLGLLPIYFGLRDLHHGVVSTVSPPDSASSPISLVTCDLTGKGDSERQQQMFIEEILRNGQGHQRLVMDLSSGSTWLLRRVADLHPIVLVPMAPDMNSALSLMAVERLFRGITDSGGRPLLPFYVLNQFDATLPLHLDVREVLRRQLGDRLLRTSIRRSPAVSEALAEGMTVLDYAPGASVSQDFLEVAAWLRNVSPPAMAEARSPLRGEW